MEDQVVEESTLWTYKDREYYVSRNIKIKDAGDGNWYDGILYYAQDDTDVAPLHFARRKDDFLAKFKPGWNEPKEPDEVEM